MPRESQNKFMGQVLASAERFRVPDLIYGSFMRQVDHTAAFMASDYHYILTTALENPPLIQIKFEETSAYRIKCFW